MAASHGRMVSRMAKILGDLAQVDYNLRVATDADIVRYAAPRRAAISEAYEICDKLSFVQPLSPELRRVYADGCLNMSLYHEEDGGRPISGCSARPKSSGKGFAAKPGRHAGAWVPCHHSAQARRCARGPRRKRRGVSMACSIALTTARGDPGLFVEIALEYARMLGPIDRLPASSRRELEDPPPRGL